MAHYPLIGKQHTTRIEQNNSHTAHHVARMARGTQVVSKREAMVDATPP